MAQREHETDQRHVDDEEDIDDGYNEQYDDDNDADGGRRSEPPPGVIQVRTQTVLFWLIGILLVLSIVNTFMVADLWFTLQHVRDAINHLPGVSTGQ